jgi:NADH dehydrogenase [ubiquinone] 1 alpha subcomplex assembly factor 7
MTDLKDIITQQIKMDGPISIADYMALCLGHPTHGYYMKKDPFGAKGDFTTAPEISQCFGELIGLWNALCWQSMGQPENIKLIELGAGRGTLLNDVLRATKNITGFHDAINLHIVEISPTLKEQQQIALEGFSLPKHWHENINDIPDGPSLIIANEFFDALPIRQFEKHQGTWAERRVGLNPETDHLQITLRADPSAPHLLAESLKGQTGDVFEICPAASFIAQSLAQRLNTFGGYLLVIDYGAEHACFGDSLQAVKDHDYCDILSTPGQADLSAHVDFLSLSKQLAHHGAKIWPLTTQGAFLETLGMGARTQQLLQGASPDQQKLLISAYKRLCSAEEMGTLFKVLCASGPDQSAPPAFES